MHSVTLKVDHYDEDTSSLVVSFETSIDGIVHTTSLMAFQPSNFHPSDKELALKGIAQLGASYLQRVIDEYKTTNNSDLIDSYKNMSNQQFNFVLSEILPTTEEQEAGGSLEVEI